MTIKEASYKIAPRGLATSFTESELPPEFASLFRNRTINSAGGAEKRQGIVQKSNTVTGAPDLKGAHELVKADGTVILFVSGGGTIYRFDDPDYNSVHTGLDSAKLRSVQMGTKLIFYNGVDTTIFTEDGTVFEDLRAIVEKGTATSGTDATGLRDDGVTNWVDDTSVVVNDLVHNRTVDAFGVVTAVVTASVAHTTISSAATGIGLTTGIQKSADSYEVLDLVELNIIPTDGDDDNTVIAAVGTSATGIQASAVSDWTLTDVRIGDFARNTTRSAVTQVTSISTAALGVIGITSQTSGDALVFLKSAMPITPRAHVHFGRLYHIDQRDNRLVRISGPNNPNDMTTAAGTLDSSSFSFGELQPLGDAALTMGSFQRFFVIAGKQNTYLFSGTDPIADETTSTVDFDIIGLFPHGAVSADGLLSIGNDVVFVSNDGVQSAALINDASTLGRANIAEQIKTTLRDKIKDTSESKIIAFHYPRRSWLCIKIGSEMYVFNYTAFFGDDKLARSNIARGGTLSPREGSWSLFDGPFARLNEYLVRRDGTLVCVGSGGKVYEFDQGTYDDDGETYATEYQTGWHTLDEPKKRVNIKKVNYMKLVLESSGIVYTVRVDGGFDVDSTETIMVTADASQSIGIAVIGEAVIGGSGTDNIKFPVRVRGEQFRTNISTSDQLGPDTISRMTYYATKHGKR